MDHEKGRWGRITEKHPWLLPALCLVCAIANGYEAIYVRPDSLMSIVDWAFAIAGALAFFALVLSAISNYLSKTTD